MDILQAIKHSKAFSYFLGRNVVENDRYHGNDSFKTLKFDSMNERGITFTRQNITSTFLWEWVKISFNVKEKSFLLTLKENPSYSISFK